MASLRAWKADAEDCSELDEGVEVAVEELVAVLVLLEVAVAVEVDLAELEEDDEVVVAAAAIGSGSGSRLSLKPSVVRIPSSRLAKLPVSTDDEEEFFLASSRALIPELCVISCTDCD